MAIPDKFNQPSVPPSGGSLEIGNLVFYLCSIWI